MATDRPYTSPYGDPERGSSRSGKRSFSLRETRDNLHDRLRGSAGERIVAIGLLALIPLMLAGLVYWVILVKELPDYRQLKQSRLAEASIAFAAGGEELTRYHDKNRTWVGLDSISQHVTDALIATEDHRFPDHWGIDVRRTFSSVAKTAAGDKQGGSTITMQFARNAFPEVADDFAYTRKVKEWITAVRIEGMFEKDEILEMYLNTVPFMYGAFGIEAAAKTYFQKPAIELSILEAATLIGMLKGTVYYNPVRNPERSLDRRNTVLQQMVKHGYLEAAEYERLKDEPIELNFRRITREDNEAPYFAEFLRQWLDEWADDRGYNLYTDGLRVYTTVDMTMQKAAEASVKEMGEQLQAVADVEWSRTRPPYFSSQASGYVNYRQNVDPFAYFWEKNPDRLNAFIKQTEAYRLARKEGMGEEEALQRLRGDAAFTDSVKAKHQRLEAGIVAIEPQTGYVRAWVGGRDFGDDQYDHVSLSKRQPGSTFKPFVYTAAIERGYSPDDVLRDEVVAYVDPQTQRRWEPKNVGGASGELVKLRDALAYSKNTITAQLVAEVGPNRVADYAHRMGIESDLQEVPSIGLGTSEVTLLELTSAYTPFANQGRYQKPTFITRIEDSQGNVLATFAPEGREVISPTTAYTVLDMMRGVVQYGTGVRIRNVFGVRSDVAGKTGTTQNGADGWFMLVHPNLVVGSWVGFNSPSIAFRSDYWGQGAHNALYVVGNFVQDVDLPDASFQPPAGYVPPPPGGVEMQFASDEYGDYDYERSRRRLDSLNNVTDSLLRERPSYDNWDPITTEDDFTSADEAERRSSDDPQPRPSAIPSTALDVEPAGTSDANTDQAEERQAEERQAEATPTEELSETDKLNRQAREKSSVSDILERIRERDGNGQGGGN